MNPGEAGFTVVRVVSCGSSRLLSGLWFLEGGLGGSVSFGRAAHPISLGIRRAKIRRTKVRTMFRRRASFGFADTRLRSRSISRSNSAFCGSMQNADYAERAIMQSHNAAAALLLTFRQRRTPH